VLKLLFVEGTGDKDFFTKLLVKISGFKNDAIDIKILVPTDLGVKKDGKEYVKQAIIKSIIRNSLDNNSVIGCIIDADYGDSQNITHILTELCKKTKDYSYDTFEQCQKSGGYYLKSNDGLKNVGIWFMPNNHQQGMLENWLLDIAKDSEKDLLEYADVTVKQVRNPKFDPIKDFAKAKVGVWTALQETPHLGIENIILQNLYNENSPEFQNFITWLKVIFQEQTP